MTDKPIPGHQLYKAIKDAHEAVNDLETALATMAAQGGYARSLLLEEVRAKKALIQAMNSKSYVEAPAGEVEIRPKAIWDTLWILYREVDKLTESTPGISAAYSEVGAALQRTGTPLPLLGSFDAATLKLPDWGGHCEGGEE